MTLYSSDGVGKKVNLLLIHTAAAAVVVVMSTDLGYTEKYTDLGSSTVSFREGIVGLAEYPFDEYAMFAADRLSVAVLNESAINCQLYYGKSLANCPEHDNYTGSNNLKASGLTLVEYPEGEYLLIMTRTDDCIAVLDLQSHSIIKPWMGQCSDDGYRISGQDFTDYKLDHPLGVQYDKQHSTLYFTTQVVATRGLIAVDLYSKTAREVAHNLDGDHIAAATTLPFSVYNNFMVYSKGTKVYSLDITTTTKTHIKDYTSDYDLVRQDEMTLILKATTVYQLMADGTEQLLCVESDTTAHQCTHIQSCSKIFKLSAHSFGCVTHSDDRVYHYKLNYPAEHTPITTTTSTTTTAQDKTVQPAPSNQNSFRFIRFGEMSCDEVELKVYRTSTPDNCIYLCVKSAHCTAVTIIDRFSCHLFMSCENRRHTDYAESYIFSATGV